MWGENRDILLPGDYLETAENLDRKCLMPFCSFHTDRKMQHDSRVMVSKILKSWIFILMQYLVLDMKILFHICEQLKPRQLLHIHWSQDEAVCVSMDRGFWLCRQTENTSRFLTNLLWSQHQHKRVAMSCAAIMWATDYTLGCSSLIHDVAKWSMWTE